MNALLRSLSALSLVLAIAAATLNARAQNAPEQATESAPAAVQTDPQPAAETPPLAAGQESPAAPPSEGGEAPAPQAAKDEPDGLVFSSPQKTSIYQEDQFKDEALLRLTNRVSARNREITLKVGMTEAYDDLLITLVRCRATPLTEKPNDSALIEVRRAPRKTTNWESTEKEKPASDQRPPKEPSAQDSADLPLLLRGWIFSESPGISALEHPVYTLRLLRCGQPPEPPKDEELPEGETAPVAGPEGETTDGKSEEIQGED